MRMFRRKLQIVLEFKDCHVLTKEAISNPYLRLLINVKENISRIPECFLMIPVIQYFLKWVQPSVRIPKILSFPSFWPNNAFRGT